jgi:hypothetical protein
MKKADITELARLGVRSKLEQLERYLADVFSEFPEEFATPTPPVFLKPEEKVRGNSWPTFTVITRNGEGGDGVIVHQQHVPPHTRKTRRSNAAWGSLGWHRIHDYLQQAPNRTARISAITRATKIAKNSVLSSMKNHPDLFRRTGVRGEVRLAKSVTHQAARTRRTTPKTHGPQPPPAWGTFHWQQIHDYLLTQDARTAKLSSIIDALKIPAATTAIGAMVTHKKLFKRNGRGSYTLIAEVPKDQQT